MKSYLILVSFFISSSIKVWSQTEATPAPTKFSFTFGTAYAFQYYNRLRQSSDKGTNIRLDNYSKSPPIALRWQFNYAINDRTDIRLLISPFSEKGEFTPNNQVISKDAEFMKGEKIESRFAFDVYRLGFSNRVTEGRFKNFKIGATLIIRKWEASLKSSTKRSFNDNWLALPLLYLGYEKNIAKKWLVTSDLDIIVAPFAYALEGGGALNYKVSRFFNLGLQYRILSGAFRDSEINNAFTTQNIGIAATIKF
jgi:hypothetical protein